MKDEYIRQKTKEDFESYERMGVAEMVFLGIAAVTFVSIIAIILSSLI